MVLTFTIFVESDQWLIVVPRTVVSLCTVTVYFIAVTQLWSPFLFLIKKRVKLAYFITQLHHKLFIIFTATQPLMCTMSLIFAAWFLDVCCQVKSGKVRAKKMGEKWNVVQMRWHSQGVFSTHTLSCTKSAYLNNLGCCGTELLTFSKWLKLNTEYLFIVLATDNDQWLVLMPR